MTRPITAEGRRLVDACSMSERGEIERMVCAVEDAAALRALSAAGLGVIGITAASSAGQSGPLVPRKAVLDALDAVRKTARRTV
jgi:hypothetical protein